MYANHKTMLITLRFISVVQSLAMQQASCRLRMNERNFHAQSHCVSLSVQFPSQRTKFFLPYLFAYIRKNVVSYGFYDKSFLLNAASYPGGLFSGTNNFYSIIPKIKHYFWFIAVIFLEMIFSVTLYVIWYVIILFTWTLFGARALRDAHMLTFFLQILWHVPNFQTCEANFSNPEQIQTPCFRWKLRRILGYIFAEKKFSKKVRLHGFFQKKFWKNAIFDNFSSLISYISELRPNTMSMVS